MYCLNCGSKISEDDSYCPNCGFDLLYAEDHDESRNKDRLPYEEPKKNVNGMAVAGFVCSFVLPILGWIFGGVGLARSFKNGGKGSGLSIAAIIISCIMFFVWQ